MHLFTVSLAKMIKHFNLKSNKEKMKENDSRRAKLASHAWTVSLGFGSSIFLREVKAN